MEALKASEVINFSVFFASKISVFLAIHSRTGNASGRTRVFVF